MNVNEAIKSGFDSDKARLQRRYNTLSAGLSTPGVDVKQIKSMLTKISEQISEIDRQLSLLE